MAQQFPVGNLTVTLYRSMVLLRQGKGSLKVRVNDLIEATLRIMETRPLPVWDTPPRKRK